MSIPQKEMSGSIVTSHLDLSIGAEPYVLNSWVSVCFLLSKGGNKYPIGAQMFCI